MINIFGDDPVDGIIYCKCCGDYLKHEDLSEFEGFDKSGNITEEELLTVTFSNDNDSTLEEKGSKTE